MTRRVSCQKVYRYQYGHRSVDSKNIDYGIKFEKYDIGHHYQTARSVSARQPGDSEGKKSRQVTSGGAR